MTSDKFSALLTILNPSVVTLIMDNRKLTNIEAATLFYNSALYEMLEKEESKLWHLSPLTLHELLEEELTTGEINYPEEA